MLRRIVTAAIGAALTLGVGAAGAYFTTQAQVPNNIIKAGEVAVSSEPTAAALSIDSLAPGSVVERPLVVVNDGSLPVDVVVTAKKSAGITDFWEALTVTANCGTTELYQGSFSQLRTQPLRLPAGARADLSFSVGLPASAGNDLAGDYVKTALYVDAEQVH